MKLVLLPFAIAASAALLCANAAAAAPAGERPASAVAEGALASAAPEPANAVLLFAGLAAINFLALRRHCIAAKLTGGH